MSEYKIIEYVRNRYSLSDKIKIFVWLLRTKIFCRNARIIRRPFYCRGKKWIIFGENFTTGHSCRIEAFDTGKNRDVKIRFGKNVQINENVHISSMQNVEIGDNVLIASFVYISDNSHGIYSGKLAHTSPMIPPVMRTTVASPVKIGNGCWIGEGVIIMPGVTIGDGCVIGAHSIVNEDIPANAIAVGAPARVMKVWNMEIGQWIPV